MVSKYRWHEAHPKGGLNLIEDENSRSIVIEILKTLGRKLMEGKFNDIMKISRPASISSPMTYLQAASRDFSFCSYLSEAALECNPVTRIQLVCAFIISGLHINPIDFKNKPPLNPVLGETHTADLSDGTKIWLEQICHHPPITSWYMQGPEGLYTFHGHGQIVAGFAGANTIKASKRGKHIITFHNGDVLEYTAPDMKITGVVMGQRNVNFYGAFEVNDLRNKMAARIVFEEDEGMIESIKGKFSKFWNKKKRLPSDFFKVKVFRYNDDNDMQEMLAEGLGSWLEYIEFNSRMVWNIQMKPKLDWKVSGDHLPSDSIYRKDLRGLSLGRIQEAQVEKDNLENLQRFDRTLRSAHKVE